MPTIKRKERVIMSQGEFDKLPSILKDKSRICVVVRKRERKEDEQHTLHL